MIEWMQYIGASALSIVLLVVAAAPLILILIMRRP
jgi:hypothetical protein